MDFKTIPKKYRPIPTISSKYATKMIIKVIELFILTLSLSIRINTTFQV